jgi:transposase
VKPTDGRKLDHKTLEEIRIRAVERVQAGESPETVIATLGFTRSCIYEWLARYRAGGWNGLKAKPLAGRPKKISARQMEWLWKTIVGTSPLQHRFEFALWTRQMVQILLWEEFRLKLSLPSVSRLLAQLGLTCQRPLFRATEQNPARVDWWLKVEYPAIRERAKLEGATIYFGDEAGVRFDYHAGTTWAPRGKTPVVRSTGARAKVNMLSVVTAKGEMRFMVTTEKVDGRLFIEFLERLLNNSEGPIFLILDGHPVHRSRLVGTFVKSTQGRLRVFFLPGYSPELNPDEQVWNHVKHHGVGRMALESRGDLARKAKSRLFSLQRRPTIIRSFFQMPETRYAAA